MKINLRFIKFRFALVAGILFALAGQLQAQGIVFMHDLDSALARAKAEKKIVFVDFYTSWCVPCKVLSTTVFPLPEVGSYYNGNFINCKVQCDDKGAGELLGKKYKINAYPTLMFLDAGGNTIHSMAGTPDSKGLIELAKTALDPNQNQLSMIQEWEHGNRDNDFMVNYFSTLKKAYRAEKATSDFETYFKGLSKEKRLEKGIFELINIVKSPPFSAPFEFLESNKKVFYNSSGTGTVDSFISNAYLWYLKGVHRNGQDLKDMTKFDSEMQKFKAKGYPYYDEYAMFYQVFSANGIEEFMSRGNEFLLKYGKDNDSYAINLTLLLGNLTGKKDQGHAGIKWMEELLGRKRDTRYFSPYIYILWRNHQWDKAITACAELRDRLSGEGKSTTEIEKQMEQIKGYKAKYND